MSSQIPIIDVSALVNNTDGKANVAKQIGIACRHYGFFYIINHGVSEELQKRLETLSEKFFALPLDVKNKYKMEYGGRAWRGYFPPEGELTSGKPDIKEGFYFGEELGSDHPLVKAETPFYGQNLFPDNEIPELGKTIIDYMAAINSLGHKLMEGIAISLGLDENYFYDRFTKEPIQLFRIFNYPPINRELKEDDVFWGVGEHTDYGLLTMLKQDNSGGLQVKTMSQWIEAPPVHNSFVCNIGDMLDRMTAGLYRSTPHRVKVQTKGNRLSFPFFFDPNFNAEIKKIEGIKTVFDDDKEERWDKESVHEFSGTYGEYLLNKVSKVFPQLRKQVI